MTSIELALEALQSLGPGEKANMTLVAKKFGVDRSTLSRRFHQVTHSKDVQYNNQRLLNDKQSKKLIEWINKLTERDLPPTNFMLANFAQEISGKEPGKNWASRWLKAHSDKVISRYSAGLDSDRKMADSASKYTVFFELLGRKIHQYNLLPEQIYNMDEKGFMFGATPEQKRIFSRRKYEQGGLKQHLRDGNREWITTIACICANGTALSPGLIYMAKSDNTQDSWLQDFDPMEQQCFFAASESGWTNYELGFRWLVDVFDKETKSQASRGWRLLILDGHSSHVNMRFINYCDRNKILLAIFPPHATQTLQPLDVGLFSHLSQAYSKQLSRFMDECQGQSRLTKRDFFRMFWTSWNIAFISENMLAAFSNTGLSPFNPELILQRFNKKPEIRASSSKSTGSMLKEKDWKRIEKLLKEVVREVCDKKALELNDTMLSLSTEHTLLKLRCEGLKRALINSKKPRIKEKSLLLDLPPDHEGGSIFFSPSKVQQARDLHLQKDMDEGHEKARKDDKMLQRAQIQEQKSQQRQKDAAEKQRPKDEQSLAKLADLQLQKDVLETPKHRTKGQNSISKRSKHKDRTKAHKKGTKQVVATNRRGRQIRLPDLEGSLSSH